ncbi:Lrp/AsnC family transcriptional regulator [Conexivisphaera calida]|uniref:Transcriptional regulator, AsnC family n=1 Tax=Conexivisphaera calida TaxID=1874277 RepID=A0A4P2VI13_9ARCH|nr:Lrp/AsnC family transcriptional regulator [Conexivisphaera calida]BBE42832.1 Transcriptional regulator, AsnC family [Conexivisphaera calida]
MDLDEVDLKILSELSENSRRSSREISRRLGLSVGTVASRIERMKEMGIIKRFTVDLDYEKLGYDITVVVDVYISKGNVVDVEREIASIPGVMAVYDVTGDFDAVVLARFRNRADLSAFTKRLMAMEHVERTNTHVVLNSVKEDFVLI